MAESTVPDPGESDGSLEARAHSLYWHSDRSVNSIADDLGLSKGRLYEVVRPVRAGRGCPNCQSDLVFENRTARERDEPTCPVCDGTQVPLSPSGNPLSHVPPLRSPRLRPTRGAPDAPAGEHDGKHDPEGGAEPSETNASSSPGFSRETNGVLAGILVGVAAGILLGRFFGK